MHIIKKLPSSLLAIFACLLWSTAFAGVKTGLKYADPLFFAGFRFLIAGLILLPFCGKIGHIVSEIKTYWRLILSVSLFQTVLLYAFFFTSLTLVEASTGAIVNGISPLIGALMAHFLLKGDRLTIRKLISFIIAVSGILIVSMNKGSLSSHLGRLAILGILFMLLGSISSAFSSIIIAKNKAAISPILLNSIQISLGGIILLILSFLIEGTNWQVFTDPKPEFFGALIYLSCLSATGFSIWFYLLKDRAVPVSILSLWKCIIPIFGVIFSWIFISEESPQLISIIGMSMTALAVLVFFVKANRAIDH